MPAVPWREEEGGKGRRKVWREVGKGEAGGSFALVKRETLLEMRFTHQERQRTEKRGDREQVG